MTDRHSELKKKNKIEMKKNNNLSLSKPVIAIVLAMAAVSCAKDDFQKEEALPSQNAISVSAVDIAPLGGEYTFTVSSDSRWTMTGIPSWLSVVPVDGKKNVSDGEKIKAGTRSFKMSAAVNDEHTGYGSSRKTTLSVESEDGSLIGEIQVEQPCPYLVIRAQKPGMSSAVVLKKSDSIVFPWNYTDEAPFSGTCEDVVFTVLSNTGWSFTKETAGKVSLDYKSYSRKSLSDAAEPEDELTASAEKGVEGGWLVSPATGDYELTGEKQWSLPFIPETYNATGEERSLRFKFTGPNGNDGKPLDEYVIDFSQKYVRFKVETGADYSTGYVEFAAAHSADVNMTVDSEIDWYVEKDADWVSTVPQAPQGVGLDENSPASSFTVNIEHQGCKEHANPEMTAKTSAFTIVGKAGNTLLPNKVNVRQSAYRHELSTSAITIGNNDLTTKNFSVISSGEWTLTGAADWLSAAPQTGIGITTGTASTSVSVRALSQNLEFTNRTAVLKVASDLNQLSSSVTISQEPFIFEATAANRSLNTLSTEKFTLDVKSSGKWRIAVTYEGSPSADWLGVSSTSGTGNASLTYGALTGNEVQQDRFATINIYSVTHEEAGVSLEPIKIKITQRKYTFEVSPLPDALGTLAFGPLSADSRTINVTCSHIWSVTGSDWITAEPSSGSGDGSVVVRVKNNLSKSDRSGTFTISSSMNGVTYSHTYNVTQSGFVFNVSGTSYVDLAPVQLSSYATAVECSGDWNVEIPSSASSWITATPATGKASDKQVVFKVYDNVEYTPRTADVKVSSALGGYSETVQFKQNEFVFDRSEVEKTLTALSPAAFDVPIVISDNAPWKVANNPSWIKVSKSSGVGNGSVTMTPENNYDLSTRGATFALVSEKNATQKLVRVNQAAFVFDTTPIVLDEYTELNSPVQQFRMGECLGTWSVKGQPDWVTVTVSGDLVTVKVADNLKKQARTAEFAVESQYVSHNSALKKKITVSQTAFVFDETAQNFTAEAFGAAANTFDVKISTGAPWTVEGAPAWITASPASGTGNGTVKLTYANNYGLSARTAGNMLVKSSLNGLTKKVTVTQKAFVFDTKSETVGQFAAYKAASSTGTVGTCIGTWTVKDAPEWLDVKVNGNTLTLTASDNLGSSARSAVLRVESQYISENPSLKKEISVSQAGFVFDQTTSSLSFTASDKSDKTVKISCTAQAPWSLVNVPSWVKVSSASGNGSAEISISVDVNTSESARKSSGFAVKSGLTGVLKPIEITQNGFIFDKTPVTLPQFAAYKASSATVNIPAGSADWNVAGLPSWISASKSGNTLTVTVSDNSSTDSRTATFRVESQYVSQNPALKKEITVAQAGYAFDTSSSAYSFTAVDSSRKTVNVSCTASSPWSLVNVPSWVEVSASSGSGSTDITISVEVNTSDSERKSSGFAVRSGVTGALKPIEVSQSGFVFDTAPVSFADIESSGASPVTVTIGEYTGSYSVIVGNPAMCSASSSGRTVTIRVSDNPDYTERTSTVTVRSKENPSKEKVITLAQKAKVQTPDPAEPSPSEPGNE